MLRYFDKYLFINSDIELCNEDLELIKDWTYNVNMSQADTLTQSGITEVQLLAKRMKSNFADVLNSQYSEDRFKVMHIFFL